MDVIYMGDLRQPVIEGHSYILPAEGWQQLVPWRVKHELMA